MYKHVRTFLAYLLIIAIVLTDVPMVANAEDAVETPVTVTEQSGGQNEDSDSDFEEIVTGTEQTETSEEPQVISELTEKRDEVTKYFAMSDGTIKACIYPQNIHYHDNEGYEEIDNTLEQITANGKNYYQNKKNSFSVRIPETFTADYIEFSDENGYVKFKLLGASNKKLEKAKKVRESKKADVTRVKNVNDRATFKSVKGNVDIIYDVAGNKLKETIVLYKKTKQSFLFDVQTSAVDAVVNNDNSISFYDLDGTEIYKIESPYMTDAAGEYSNAVKTTLTKAEEGYTLTYAPDYEWLSAKERVYPVEIDPTLVQAIYKETVTDTYVGTIQTATNNDIRGGWDVLNVGRRAQISGGSQIVLRGLIRFDIPSEIGNNDCIVDAKLDLVHYLGEGESVNGIQIDAHELTSSFSEGGTWWGNQPTYDSVIADYAIVNTNRTFAGTSISYDSYNLTKLVNKWHNGSANHGILLKLHDDTGNVSSNMQVFYFAKQSVYYGSISKFVEITYRNTTGLEDYWSYTAQEFGRYGTGYVNNYNGNLVYVHDDVTFNSGINGFMLSHVYNACNATKSYNSNGTMGYYGAGWNLNLVQKLEPVTVTGHSNVKYKFTDGDGTEHYLVENTDGDIIDEDGLGLTYADISEGELKRKLTDQNGNVYKFDQLNYMRQIIDANGNIIYLNYSPIPDVDHYLTSITTSSGGSFIFTYDSNYNLISIADNAGRKTTYTYTGSNLTGIQYPDGSALKLEYHPTISGMAGSYSWLCNIIAPDGRKINYEYYDSNGRIEWAWFLGITGEWGAWHDFFYSQNQTRVEDQYDRNIYYQFDTWGIATCIYDDEQNIYTQTYTKTNTKGSSVFSNNKVNVASNGIHYNNNYLNNGCFLNDFSSWSKYSETGDQTNFSVVGSQNYISSKSIKISCGTNSTEAILQNPVCPSNRTYTYSGYIKTENVVSRNHGAALEVITRTGDGGTRFHYSEFLTGTTDDEVDNGFTRVSVTFVLGKGESVDRVTAGLYAGTGTVYINALQIEEGETANTINLVSNSSMEYNSGAGTMPQGYTTNDLDASCTAVTGEKQDGAYSFKINAHSSQLRNISQSLPMSGKSGDIYSFGGWVKANSAPTNGSKIMSLSFCFLYTDGSYDWIIFDYNPNISDWQFGSKVAIAKSDYTKIGIYFCYYKNCNVSYCDNLFIYRDTAQSYVYDNNGNIVTTADYATQQSTYEYANNNISKLIDAKGTGYEYIYDGNNNLKSSRSSEGVQYDITYDSFGNAISSEVGSNNYATSLQNGKTYYIRLKSDGKYLTVSNAGTTNSTNVIEAEFCAGSHQKWKLESTSDGYYVISPQHASDMALDIANEADVQDTNVQIHKKNNSKAQKFKIIPQNDYTYKVTPACTVNGKIVTVNHAVTSNNVTILTPQGNNNADQEWCFEDAEIPIVTEIADDTIYQFRARYSGKYIDLRYNDSALGTVIEQYENSFTVAQKFVLNRYEDTEYFTIAPKGKERLIEVSTENDASGYPFLMSGDSTVTERKLFKFVYNSTYQGFQIIPKCDETTAVDIANGSINNEATLVLAPITSASNQFFIAEKMSDTITASATYQDNGNYPHTITDSRGNVTTYTYDTSRGLATAVTDAKNNITEYTYNSLNDRLENVKTGDSTVNYQYNTVGTLKNITSPSGTIYNFNYDLYGRENKISVGGQMLSETIYRDGYLPLASRFNYGNGAYLTYEYDNQDRLISEGANGSARRTYVYDKLGNIAKINDLSVNVVTNFQYDLIERVVGTKSSDGQNTRFVYDKYNRLSLLKWTFGDISHSNEYIYGDESADGQKTGLIYGVKLNGTQKVGYQYDELSRQKNRIISTDTPFVTEYTYLEGAGYGTTTTLVKTVKNGSDILEYTYDALGNITTVSKNGVVIEQYSYDALNQLVSAVYGGNTYVYAYDNGGNLTEIKKNDEVIKSYSYGNAEWKDQLTSFNGETITYDAIGNPLTYRNGLAFTWENGRQFASVSQNGTALASYTYNADGLRTSKTVNGVTTDYYWSNGNLQGQKTGEEYLLFLYDENDKAYGFIVKNGTSETTYYYEFNVQGDIIGIIDSTGTRVVEYTYGAWGDIVSITGTLADTIGQKNPLRYRGYYYDVETGFYYVSSRYYDPEIGRFINADTTDILGVEGNLYDKNPYAYCDNNPIMRKDVNGEFWVVAVCVGLATQYVGDVIANIADGVTGADIFSFRSTAGEYIAAGVTALIPGSGLTGSLIRNVATEAIVSVERHIKGQSNSLAKSATRVALGTVIDTGVEKVTNSATKYISSKTSKTYSQYAKKAQKRNPTASTNAIRQSAQRSVRWGTRLSNCINFIANALRSALAW